MNERFDYIDAAKGIGILCVVLGHIIPFGSFMSKLFFSFHMPLFFFLSGMTYNEKKYVSLKLLLITKSKTLLLPFVVTAVITLLINFAVPAWRETIASPMNFAKLVLLSDPHDFRNGPIWFLVCLFMVHILYYFFGKNFIAIFIAAVFAMTINRLFDFGEQIIALEGLKLFFPFKLDVACMGILFFSVGHMLKEKYNFCTSHHINICKILSAVLLIFTSQFNTVDMRSSVYGNPILFFLNAFLGIFVVISISRAVCRVRFLLDFGRNSIVILKYHVLIINIAILAINRIAHTSYEYLVNISFGAGIAIFTIIVIYTYVSVFFKKLLIPGITENIKKVTKRNLM